jgi:hypothetical protein
MDTKITPKSDEQKDCQAKADLFFADAHKKAKSLKRISTARAQNARIREVLFSLREGLIAGQIAKSGRAPPRLRP